MVRWREPRPPRGNMENLRTYLTYAFVALILFVTYQGYQNSRPGEDTLELSRSHACDLESGCIVVGVHRGRRVDRETPTAIKTDPLRRRYEWETNRGSVTVTCTRSNYFIGPWSCVTTRGKLYEAPTSNRTF